MLDNLLEIEVAYSLLKSGSDENSNPGKDPIDVHYEKLNTSIEVKCISHLISEQVFTFCWIFRFWTRPPTSSMFSRSTWRTLMPLHTTSTPWTLKRLKNLLFAFKIIFIHDFVLGFQNQPERREQEVQALQAAASQTAVARLQDNELCWHSFPRLEDRPARGPRDRLHVWQGHLFRGHGVQVGQLLQHHPLQQHGSPLALRRRSRQHVRFQKKS